MKKFDFVKNFKYFAIAAVTVVLIGMIMLGVIGFNASSDYKGGYEVKCEAGETLGDSAEVMKKTADKFFKDNKMRVVSVKNQDEGRILVYEFKNEVAETVKTDLGAAMEAAFEGRTITVEVTTSPTVAHRSVSDVWWAVLAAGVLLVLAFFYLVLRYRWAAAFAMLAAVVADLLLTVALTALTRVPVTTAYLSVVMLGAALTIMTCVYLFSLIKEDVRLTSNSDTPENYANRATVKSLLAVTVLFGAVLLAVIAMLAIGGLTVKFTALQILVAAVGAAFVSVGLTGSFYAVFKHVKLGKKK